MHWSFIFAIVTITVNSVIAKKTILNIVKSYTKPHRTEIKVPHPKELVIYDKPVKIYESLEKEGRKIHVAKYLKIDGAEQKESQRNLSSVIETRPKDLTARQWLSKHTLRGFSNVKASVWDAIGKIFNVTRGKSLKTPEESRAAGVPEDAYLNIRQLASKYGYEFEEYETETADGYRLTVHRIPHGRNRTIRHAAVFLMHGILDSADSWLLSGPDRALAYILADHGYDVWLGNARGSKYSTRHSTLDPEQADYWKFTWDEIGRYDLPAMIEFALKMSREKHIYYVGHSQGTTSFLVMASTMPEFAARVRLAFGLAPVAYISHARSPLVRALAPAFGALDVWLTYMNVYSPALPFLNRIMQLVCYVLSECNDLISLLVGANNDLIKPELLPVIYGHMPSDASTLQFVHYGQLVASGRFCQYDHGAERNLQLYGQTSPPDYNLTKVTVPMVLFYSENDWLSDPKDVALLKSKLPNVYNEIFIKQFNHIDFMYAHNAVDYIYGHIVELIDEYENFTSLVL